MIIIEDLNKWITPDYSIRNTDDIQLYVWVNTGHRVEGRLYIDVCEELCKLHILTHIRDHYYENNNE